MENTTLKSVKNFIAALLAAAAVLTATGCTPRKITAVTTTTNRLQSSQVTTAAAPGTATTTDIVTDAPITTVPETTAPEPEPEPEPEPTIFELTISIAGDCTLASNLNKYYGDGFKEYAEREDPAYFLDAVADVFENDDFSIVNLECVLSDRDLKPLDKGYTPAYWFLGPASNADILTSHSIEAVSLSNNHTGDYGTAGISDTKEAVEAAGLLWGDGYNTLYLEKDGFTIALICNGLWYESQASQIVKRIEEASEKSDFQIVYYHGGTEKLHEPESWKMRASRKLVDAGADLVIGNHPHVLQPLEVYNGVPIIYSIANFCFGGNKRPENRTMIYQTTLTIDKETNTVIDQTYEIIPCYVYTGESNNYQPAIIEDEEDKQKVLDFMNGLRDLPY